MPKKRTQWEILNEILELCKIPRKKTHVVYFCNLNFKVYKKYVDRLMEVGYLEYNGTYFLTTEEGLERLNEWVPVLMNYDAIRVY